MTQIPETLSNLDALHIEANRQLDNAIESGDARVWGKGAVLALESEGIHISRVDPNLLTVKVDYDETVKATGKLLDLTVEVEYFDYDGERSVQIYEERQDPESRSGGRRNVPNRKHEETAGILLKVLAQVI